MVLLWNHKTDTYCITRLPDAHFNCTPNRPDPVHMNLYRVHNLPMLHPTLQMHVQYEIEGPYLATLMDSMYITLPTDIDVRLCLMTKGHLCMFNQALYPVDNTNWCIYALFINDINKIKKNCILKPLNRTTNLAYSLDGYLWAISALAAENYKSDVLWKHM